MDHHLQAQYFFTQVNSLAENRGNTAVKGLDTGFAFHLIM